MDLCGIELSQLRDGRLNFRPDQTKGRRARSVPLPAELVEQQAVTDEVMGQLREGSSRQTAAAKKYFGLLLGDFTFKCYSE
jgi:hypothetical protein